LVRIVAKNPEDAFTKKIVVSENNKLIA